jgi:hypothetical protein
MERMKHSVTLKHNCWKLYFADKFVLDNMKRIEPTLRNWLIWMLLRLQQHLMFPLSQQLKKRLM